MNETNKMTRMVLTYEEQDLIMIGTGKLEEEYRKLMADTNDKETKQYYDKKIEVIKKLRMRMDRG